MKASTGRPVSGADFFFNRDKELQVLETRVRDGNHVLLTGQRRMGKTSLTLELGRRLELQGWVFLFVDVEGATCAEDAIAAIATVAHRVRPISSRLVLMRRWLGERVEELGALDFRVKLQAGLNTGTWRRHGAQLIDKCANHDKKVLLVIDELPIFLKRMLGPNRDVRRVDEFLSWLRGVTQGLKKCSPVLIVSGSIGLKPLVQRLGLSDRINHLYPFRLGPWDRDVSIECFERLAENYGLRVEDGVANAVYDALGVGIPYHVQLFFSRLQDFTIKQSNDRVTVDDVGTVYTELLGPSGQNDLAHYESRLKDGLDEDSYRVAMESLAKSAQGVFTRDARHCLERKYAQVVDDAPGCVTEALEVLVHDGYLESSTDGYRFPSRLLKDWWAARFRDHHVPVERRLLAPGVGSS